VFRTMAWHFGVTADKKADRGLRIGVALCAAPTACLGIGLAVTRRNGDTKPRNDREALIIAFGYMRMMPHVRDATTNLHSEAVSPTVNR
jgi:hypothetical protein